MKFSIVIPAYNESDKIINTLSNVVSFMDYFNPDYEVLVCNDGSVDSTASLVRDFSKEHPKIKLVDNSHRGKGPTIWSGVMTAEGDFIYVADADLSAPMSELKKMYVWISEQNYDLVIASREGIGANRVGEPFYRHLMGRIFNLLVQSVLLPGIKDSQCGFKLFKKDAAKQLFAKLKVYGPEALEIKDAYLGAFDVEVLYIAKKLGFRVKEVPVTWQYVKTTRLNPIADSLKMARDVLLVKINYSKGVYK